MFVSSWLDLYFGATTSELSWYLNLKVRRRLNNQTEYIVNASVIKKKKYKEK